MLWSFVVSTQNHIRAFRLLIVRWCNVLTAKLVARESELFEVLQPYYLLRQLPCVHQHQAHQRQAGGVRACVCAHGSGGVYGGAVGSAASAILLSFLKARQQEARTTTKTRDDQQAVLGASHKRK